MLKALWSSLVMGSMVFLVGYLAFAVFYTPEPQSIEVDPLESLFRDAVAEAPRPRLDVPERVIESAEPIVKEVAPAPEVSSRAAVESALFAPAVEGDQDEYESENQQDVARQEAARLEVAVKTLGSIEQELRDLPGGPESDPARSVLLHTASTLELDERGADEVHELAMNELLYGVDSPEAQSSSFTYFLPVLAHEVALKTAYDSTEALTLTVDGLLVHRDPGVRHSLVRQFVAKFPDLELQLKEELYIRNITPDFLGTNF